MLDHERLILQQVLQLNRHIEHYLLLAFLRNKLKHKNTVLLYILKKFICYFYLLRIDNACNRA